MLKSKDVPLDGLCFLDGVNEGIRRMYFAESDYLNHIMGCEDCWPANDKLCASGREFWIKSKVESLLSEGSIENRRLELSLIREQSPKWINVVESRFIKAFTKKKQVSEV
jgi:hypothetical protein